MNIKTFSILVGSEACDARCGFCVSKMTPPLGVTIKPPPINWKRFKVACALAEKSGVTTAMLTSKGESTLFPDQVTSYIRALEGRFPIVELQTNAIKFMESDAQHHYLAAWADHGLTTVAISIVHHDPTINHLNYVPYKANNPYEHLPELIDYLHDANLSVRLCCVLLNEWIYDPAGVQAMIAFARGLSVEQLTLTPVNAPEESDAKDVIKWTNGRILSADQVRKIWDYLDEVGTNLLTLSHGAVVFDVAGQNVCLNNCLSVRSDTNELRNLIFYPDGHLRYYWQHPGAILL